jgi:type IV secretion system protein TrbG
MDHWRHRIRFGREPPRPHPREADTPGHFHQPCRDHRPAHLHDRAARAGIALHAFAWAYPAAPAGSRATTPAAPIIPAEAARNYRYGLQVRGDSPPWRPLSVFDDGRRVYVIFSRGIVQGEMPPLFVIGSDGETQIVNSRVHQNVLIVDRLFGAAELRLGSGDRQQVVRIVRINPTQAAAEPASTTTGGSSS